MYDFSKELTKFHNDHVRLTNGQRANMKERREANHKRIKNGLNNLKKPQIVEAINQGGYAQKTMVQPPEPDVDSRYDIDLGVVFEADDAVGARTTRGWVRDAIANQGTNLKNDPESKKNCVRVIYADGYQCDFPVFRRSWDGFEFDYELSSGDEWVQSDPKSMNKWVESQVAEKSPEHFGNYQLRRIIRLGKYYCKTHSARQNLKFPSGLLATALFIEAYDPVLGNDDEAFYKTLQNISCRDEYSPVYANGVDISDDKDTARIRRLIETAEDSVFELEQLEYEGNTQASACEAWNKVFHHSYFDNFAVSESFDASAGFGTYTPTLGQKRAAAPTVAGQNSALTSQEKITRLESVVNPRRQSGAGTKPWSNRKK